MNAQAFHQKDDGMVENSVLSAALDYAALEWPVFPVWWIKNGKCACGKANCQHPGKHPMGALVPNGRNSATTNPEIIKKWWKSFPQANIGIATGKESRLVVVDLDPRNGGDPDRLPCPVPRTPTARTGGLGWHFYFAHPGNGFKFPAKLSGCPGTDLKSSRGYVVAPPSLHISGKRYLWLAPPATTPLAPCPVWLLEAVRKPKPRPTAAPPRPPIGALGTPYGRAALRNELVRLAQTPEGGRNIALNQAAYSLGKLVGTGHLEEGDVASLLATVAANIGLPVQEVERTLRSGMTAGREVAHV